MTAAHADLCDNGIPSTSGANQVDLKTARDIALGLEPIASCPGLNANGDTTVTVGEIVGGISRILTLRSLDDGGSATGLLDPVVLEVGTAWGSADELVTFDVKLTSSAGLVAGAQIDINFDSQTVIPEHLNPIFAGAPFCDVNPAINKNQSAFAFQGINAIRGIIISFTNINPIPEGSVLFTCHVKIAPTAPEGSYALPCSNPGASTALGVGLPTTCRPGAVVVIAPTVIDHYKCYQGSDLKNPKFTKVPLTMDDQFVNDDPGTALKLKFVCTPVDKNGEGIEDPATHLACYGLKANALSSEPRVLASTQFQSTQFQLNKPKMLCVPATKTLLP